MTILSILLLFLLLIPPAMADLMVSHHSLFRQSLEWEYLGNGAEKAGDHEGATQCYGRARSIMMAEYQNTGKEPDSEYYRRMMFYSNKMAVNLHDDNLENYGGKNEELSEWEKKARGVAGQAEKAYAESEAKKRTGSSLDCLIVTATFGSPMADEVQLVRDFRDNTIQKGYLGSRYVTALNALYYSFSPAVARSIDDNPAVKPVMRILLAPLIAIVLLSQGVYSLLSFSPGIATIVFIITGGALVGIVYVLPVMLPALWVAGKRGLDVLPIGSIQPLVIVWAGLLAALLASAVVQSDTVAVMSSGLLFVSTVFLTAGAAALYLFRYLGIKAVRSE